MSTFTSNVTSVPPVEHSKRSVSEAFNLLMGRTYSPIETSPNDHLIYHFLKTVKKNKSELAIQQKIRQFHPLNQQAILMSAISFSKENNLENSILEAELKTLEETKKLNPIQKIKFDDNLENKIYSTALKILLVSCSLFLVSFSTYFVIQNRYEDRLIALENEIGQNNNVIASLSSELFEKHILNFYYKLVYLSGVLPTKERAYGLCNSLNEISNRFSGKTNDHVSLEFPKRLDDIFKVEVKTFKDAMRACNIIINHIMTQLEDSDHHVYHDKEGNPIKSCQIVNSDPLTFKNVPIQLS